MARVERKATIRAAENCIVEEWRGVDASDEESEEVVM